MDISKHENMKDNDLEQGVANFLCEGSESKLEASI